MGKGSRCPECGELTFHAGKGTHKCSSCGAIGWYREPQNPGSGKGAECKSCGANTTRKVGTKDQVSVWHCANCGVTHLA
jgi:ribosomal protein L37AE/L43A